MLKLRALAVALAVTSSSVVVVSVDATPVKALSNCTAIVAGIQGYPYYRWGGICYGSGGTIFMKAVQTCRIGATTYVDQYGNAAQVGQKSWTPTCNTGVISNRRYYFTNFP